MTLIVRFDDKLYDLDVDKNGLVGNIRDTDEEVWSLQDFIDDVEYCSTGLKLSIIRTGFDDEDIIQAVF